MNAQLKNSGVYGEPPERNSIDRHSRVLEVGGVAQQLPRKRSGQLEEPVMISTTNHPVLDGHLSQPAIEREYFLRVQTRIHEVACVSEDISVGEIFNRTVQAVCIGSYYQGALIFLFLSLQRAISANLKSTANVDLGLAVIGDQPQLASPGFGDTECGPSVNPARGRNRHRGFEGEPYDLQ
jgi:hypothetical protein